MHHGVKELVLFDNGLTAPPDLRRHPDLVKLNLSTNKLATPPDASSCASLTQLWLSDNNLTAPPNVSGCASLSELDLSSNKLFTAPDVSRCTSLAKLLLRNNKLATSPSVSGCPNLVEINLEDNELTAPPDLSRCVSLMTLSLSGNKLTTAPDVSGCASLAELELRYNKIAEPPNVSRCASLTSLGLSDNKLTTPPDVSGCTRLEVLDLDNNQLAALPAIHACNNLRQLSLENNALTGPLYPAADWPNTLLHVDVSGNPGLWGEIPKSLVAQCQHGIQYGGCRDRSACSAEQKRLLQFMRGPFFVGFTVASQDIGELILAYIDELAVTEANMLDAPARGDPAYAMMRTHGAEWTAWQEVWADGLFALPRGSTIWAILTEGHFRRKLEGEAAFDTDAKCRAVSFDPTYRLPAETRASTILDWEAKQFAIAQEKNGLVVKRWMKGKVGEDFKVAEWYPVPHAVDWTYT